MYPNISLSSLHLISDEFLDHQPIAPLKRFMENSLKKILTEKGFAYLQQEGDWVCKHPQFKIRMKAITARTLGIDESPDNIDTPAESVLPPISLAPHVTVTVYDDGNAARVWVHSDKDNEDETCYDHDMNDLGTTCAMTYDRRTGEPLPHAGLG